MLRQKYKSFLLDSVFKNQIWMIISVVLLLSNLLLSMKILASNTNEKTIIHPINLSQAYSTEGDSVDPNYVGELAEEFLRARFLYTPKTVRSQFDNIAKHFHPAIYGDKKAELDAEAEIIMRNDETSVFFPMSVHVKQKTAYVESEITGYLGKKPVSQNIRIHEVSFKNSGGRIWLYSWREVQLDAQRKNYIPINDFKHSDVRKGESL